MQLVAFDYQIVNITAKCITSFKIIFYSLLLLNEVSRIPLGISKISQI